MAKFSSLVLLASALLATASVVPLQRAPDVAREPEYPLYLAKREAAGRNTRHLRPVYENTKRDITLPDIGQVATFPPTGIPQPIRGPYGDIRTGGTNEEIDRQNPDYVAPPLSDSGVFVSSDFLNPLFLITFLRKYSQPQMVFLIVSQPPLEGRLDSGADCHRPSNLCVPS